MVIWPQRASTAAKDKRERKVFLPKKLSHTPLSRQHQAISKLLHQGYILWRRVVATIGLVNDLSCSFWPHEGLEARQWEGDLHERERESPPWERWDRVRCRWYLRQKFKRGVWYGVVCVCVWWGKVQERERERERSLQWYVWLMCLSRQSLSQRISS